MDDGRGLAVKICQDVTKLDSNGDRLLAGQRELRREFVQRLTRHVSAHDAPQGRVLIFAAEGGQAGMLPAFKLIAFGDGRLLGLSRIAFSHVIFARVPVFNLQRLALRGARQALHQLVTLQKIGGETAVVKAGQKILSTRLSHD